MNDIIKIKKLLEDSGVLIDGVTENVKNKLKKTRRRTSWNFVSTFNRFISKTSNFFSSERYKWKGSKWSREHYLLTEIQKYSSRSIKHNQR